MKRILCQIGVILLWALLVSPAAEKTWTGKISDSMCGTSHAGMQHGNKKVSDRECTLECVKGGAEYVLVTEEKILDIENQDFAGLKEHAGQSVKVTGEMSPDKKSITISKIEAGAGDKAKPSKG
jgi:hypothetical protein